MTLEQKRLVQVEKKSHNSAKLRRLRDENILKRQKLLKKIELENQNLIKKKNIWNFLC